MWLILYRQAQKYEIYISRVIPIWTIVSVILFKNLQGFYQDRIFVWFMFEGSQSDSAFHLVHTFWPHFPFDTSNFSISICIYTEMSPYTKLRLYRCGHWFHAQNVKPEMWFYSQFNGSRISTFPQCLTVDVWKKCLSKENTLLRTGTGTDRASSASYDVF